MKRRSVVAAVAGMTLAPLGLGGCGRSTADSIRYDGNWTGADHQRGHLLRDQARNGFGPEAGATAVARRTSVLIIGAGVAGLACARALQRRGIEDFHLLDLEDHAGGNSRGHQMAGMACPLGAHYLPVPGDHMGDLIELLAGFDLCQQRSGRWVYDERHLCHSPQERLFVADSAGAFGGHWIEGLLPPPELLPQAQRASTLADYRRFAALVDHHLRSRQFAIPTQHSSWTAELGALDAISFQLWLDREGLHSRALRWFLDYCCRDDYGAGLGRVSAWAGLQYFASRHGFSPPGEPATSDSAGVLTWAEGNSWLTTRMAQPQGDRLHLGRTALRITEGRFSVDVSAWDHSGERLERWTANRVVLATPLFIAARLLSAPSSALQAAAGQLAYAPWLVANLHLDQALRDRPGAPPSWDNVVYGSRSLGYVDAMHQSTRPHPGPTVLTAYWALGGDDAAQASQARFALLQDSWQVWAERVLDELAPAHADLRGKLRRVDLMRYGHAMCIPRPGTRSHPALAALTRSTGRIAFAHSDLSGYSIFEEAFFHGHRAGSQLKV